VKSVGKTEDFRRPYAVAAGKDFYVELQLCGNRESTNLVHGQRGTRHADRGLLQKMVGKIRRERSSRPEERTGSGLKNVARGNARGRSWAEAAHEICSKSEPTGGN
jgi:hypothetical protein